MNDRSEPFWTDLHTLLEDMRKYAKEHPEVEILSDDDPGNTAEARSARIGWVAITPAGDVARRWDIRARDATASGVEDVRTTKGRARLGAAARD